MFYYIPTKYSTFSIIKFFKPKYEIFRKSKKMILPFRKKKIRQKKHICTLEINETFLFKTILSKISKGKLLAHILSLK